jgi:type IX secretion system PorP/SprF family membrane protein
MMRSLPLLVWLALLAGAPLMAQDPTFSQFYINRLYLSPALVGLDPGTTFNVSYRNQWPGVSGAFNTASASVELQEPCLSSAFAASGFYDRAGEGGFQTLGFGLHYAYIIGPKRSNVHIGMRGGFVQRSIDWSKLVFSDQLDPVYGIVRGTAAAQVMEKVMYPDFDAGIAWRQEYDHPVFKKTPIRSLLGVAVSHLLRPDQSFYDIESIVPRRWTIHGALEIPMSPYQRRTGRHYPFRKFFLMPNFKYEWQGESSAALNQGRTHLLTYGMYVQTPSPLYFGALLQHQRFDRNRNNTNALVLTSGVAFSDDAGRRYTVGGSYDFNVKGLTTRAGGAFEINFRMVLTGQHVACKGSPRESWKQENMKRIQDCDGLF